MSEEAKVCESVPVVPGELWGLWMDDVGGWVLAGEGAVDSLMCFKSLADAEQSAVHHRDWHDIECRPARLK